MHCRIATIVPHPAVEYDSAQLRQSQLMDVHRTKNHRFLALPTGPRRSWLSMGHSSQFAHLADLSDQIGTILERAAGVSPG